MFNTEKIVRYADDWAYDVSKNVIRTGEMTNVDVINQSIEMILATPPGTRLFNGGFGSRFMFRIFDSMDEDYLESVIDDTLESIKRWEDRITIIDGQVRLSVNTNNNSMLLTIPYIIKDRQIKGEFSKVISQ